ncbi:MarR family winged helix-turn-helix transcriptional regulator [Marinomonas mediterranea]|jgi:Transcriptional regulators|uniref:Transcriptional regulator, MarR family n=1 Tax=Marinomonas mediterranea (strain ATCC 700492 / JCM 21426 / NBRC 103028 / MMB-1) TaxID=717774 RepID=F2JXE1_MARM1|nr:MarR family transcriptional regulator [Marinomonas mediterranea]ADZ91841.1 transcriptional regulator, MarR family [Marinomonas mediterranea MMB-1]WCN09794.1 MarR family transcriptional regulator [Marinomonas mediterranea]WCN13877.1 MarR family transcriptional regulator [Marinomonas mediterranea]WCN17933.1 MarR family transcriptional regulator [Marinomonas mediterranea MMB-1]
MSPENKDADNKIDYGLLDKVVGYRLRRAQMNFFATFSEVFSDLGISPGLFAVIALVESNPGRTQTAIAQALGNDRSAMVAAVDKLEKMKIIERRPSKSDRRSYALYMTQTGNDFFKTASKRVMDHEKEMTSCLKDEKEVAWLLETLRTLSD